ncbi:MAG: SpoIIE family protein phosphatase [Phycisphaerales bacterium]|nr:SpoIIE family protein phosphatase [Phycisphaerales bacterium]
MATAPGTLRLTLLAIEGPVAEVTCARDPVYIGSDDQCALRLPDVEDGPRAVVMLAEDGAWVVEPADDSSELLLNGAALEGRAPIRDGDRLEILDYTVEATLDPTDDAPVVDQPLRATTSLDSLTRFVKFQLPHGSLVRRIDDPITIAPEYLRRLGRLNIEIAQFVQPEQLISAALERLLETFHGQRGWVGIRRVNYGPMDYVEGRLRSGETSDLSEIGDKLKPRVLDRSQFVMLPQVPDKPGSVMAGPLCGPDCVLGMAVLETGETGRVFTSADLDMFITMMNLFGVQLHAIFAQIAKVREATLDGEVNVAHAIQAKLTPRMLPQWPELQFGAFREPGKERTGDVYDVLRLSNKMAGFFVAHTSAKGAMPSMLMAQAQATFRACAMHLDSPHLVMRALNHLLYDGLGDRPLDCFVGYIDPSSGDMRYAQAGTMGSYIISARGEERPLTPNPATASLGVEKQPAHPTLSARLEPSESLALFTPGVTTARNAAGETFGEDRFVNILCDGFGQLASAMLKEMLNDFRVFTAGGAQPDDTTVLLAHRVE